MCYQALTTKKYKTSINPFLVQLQKLRRKRFLQTIIIHGYTDFSSIFSIHHIKKKINRQKITLFIEVSFLSWPMKRIPNLIINILNKCTQCNVNVCEYRVINIQLHINLVLWMRNRLMPIRLGSVTRAHKHIIKIHQIILHNNNNNHKTQH